MSITMFRIAKRDAPEAKIVRVECVRVTPEAVYIHARRQPDQAQERRDELDNAFFAYYETFEKARTELMVQASGRVARLKTQLEAAQDAVGAIHCMQEPTNAFSRQSEDA
jgi:hypothetical protein